MPISQTLRPISLKFNLEFFNRINMKRIVLFLGVITAIVALLTAYETHAQPNQNITMKPQTTMKYQDVYPVFVTKDLKACKEFYGTWFNLQPVFESSFFILLVSA